jgi:hypothetical protein
LQTKNRLRLSLESRAKNGQPIYMHSIQNNARLVKDNNKTNTQNAKIMTWKDIGKYAVLTLIDYLFYFGLAILFIISAKIL